VDLPLLASSPYTDKRPKLEARLAARIIPAGRSPTDPQGVPLTNVEVDGDVISLWWGGGGRAG
jgi:hypothetical protein